MSIQNVRPGGPPPVADPTPPQPPAPPGGTPSDRASDAAPAPRQKNLLTLPLELKTTIVGKLDRSADLLNLMLGSQRLFRELNPELNVRRLEEKARNAAASDDTEGMFRLLDRTTAMHEVAEAVKDIQTNAPDTLHGLLTSSKKADVLDVLIDQVRPYHWTHTHPTDPDPNHESLLRPKILDAIAELQPGEQGRRLRAVVRKAAQQGGEAFDTFKTQLAAWKAKTALAPEVNDEMAVELCLSQLRLNGGTQTAANAALVKQAFDSSQSAAGDLFRLSSDDWRGHLLAMVVGRAPAGTWVSGPNLLRQAVMDGISALPPTHQAPLLENIGVFCGSLRAERFDGAVDNVLEWLSGQTDRLTDEQYGQATSGFVRQALFVGEPAWIDSALKLDRTSPPETQLTLANVLPDASVTDWDHAVRQAEQYIDRCGQRPSMFRMAALVGLTRELDRYEDAAPSLGDEPVKVQLFRRIASHLQHLDASDARRLAASMNDEVTSVGQSTQYAECRSEIEPYLRAS